MTNLSPDSLTPPVPSTPVPPDQTSPRRVGYWRTRARIGMAIAIVGFLLLLLGAKPSLFGLDRSPVVGFIQIAVFLIGLLLLVLGGYVGLIALWSGQPISIPADIGVRLIATGYVISLFSGMADIFGFGSQTPPKLPLLGPLQAMGVEIGQVMIGLGFLMMIPFNRWKK